MTFTTKNTQVQHRHVYTGEHSFIHVQNNSQKVSLRNQKVKGILLVISVK